MHEPISKRGGISQYFVKTEQEYREDKYEQYFQQVLKACHLYFGSDFGKNVSEFLLENCVCEDSKQIVEVGGGIAYYAAALAQYFPKAEIICFDSSYQMLKMAAEIWKYDDLKSSKELTIPATQNGFMERIIGRKSLENLNLGMAKAEDLPLADSSVDMAFSVALWDRLIEHDSYLKSMKRILKADAKLIILTPLNYQKAADWQNWYPLSKLIEKLCNQGFDLIKHQTLVCDELIDDHGNFIRWNYEGMVFQKS